METTPNFNSNSSKPSDGLQLLIHHGLQQLPVDIEETMLHPNPLRCFMQNKNINESKHPFACQDGLKKLRLVGLVAPILFWLLQSSSTRKHVCWPFCLPNFEELQWQQELLEPPKVKFAQPFRSGGVGLKIRQQMPWSTIIVCVCWRKPWKFNGCTPPKKSQNVIAMEKDGTCPTSSFQLWGCFWGGRGVRRGWNLVW